MTRTLACVEEANSIIGTRPRDAPVLSGYEGLGARARENEGGWIWFSIKEA